MVDDGKKIRLSCKTPSPISKKVAKRYTGMVTPRTSNKKNRYKKRGISQRSALQHTPSTKSEKRIMSSSSKQVHENIRAGSSTPELNTRLQKLISQRRAFKVRNTSLTNEGGEHRNETKNFQYNLNRSNEHSFEDEIENDPVPFSFDRTPIKDSENDQQDQSTIEIDAKFRDKDKNTSYSSHLSENNVFLAGELISQSLSANLKRKSSFEEFHNREKSIDVVQEKNLQFHENTPGGPTIYPLHLLLYKQLAGIETNDNASPRYNIDVSIATSANGATKEGLNIESIMYIAQLEEEILLMKNTINEQQQNIDKKETFIKSLRILIDDKDNKIEQEQKARVQAEINEKTAEVRAIKKATNEARITAVEQIRSMLENQERNTIAQTNLLEQKFKKVCLELDEVKSKRKEDMDTFSKKSSCLYETREENLTLKSQLKKLTQQIEEKTGSQQNIEKLQEKRITKLKASHESEIKYYQRKLYLRGSAIKNRLGGEVFLSKDYTKAKKNTGDLISLQQKVNVLTDEIKILRKSSTMKIHDAKEEIVNGCASLKAYVNEEMEASSKLKSNDLIDSSLTAVSQEMSISCKNVLRIEECNTNNNEESTFDQESNTNKSVQCSLSMDKSALQEPSSARFSDNSWLMFTLHFLQALNGCYKENNAFNSRYLDKDNALKLIKELGFSHIDENMRIKDMHDFGYHISEENEVFLDASEV